MKKMSARLIAILLVTAIITGVAGLYTTAADIGVTISETDTVAMIQSRIIGAMTPGVTSVTVTGVKSYANQTLKLDIPAGVSINWNAEYKGSVNPVIDLTGVGIPKGAFIVGTGGAVVNTSTSSFTAIRAGINVDVIIDDGEVSAILGSAIEGSGSNTTVTVNGGTVYNSATNNLRPVINMTDITNTGDNVTVNSGEVSARATSAGAYGYCIQSYGNVEINDGLIYTNGFYGRGVNLTGNNSLVTVNGGNVIAYGSGGVALSTATTAGVVVNNTTIIVNGGFVAAYGTGNSYAIHTTGTASTVTINNGCVFSLGDRISGSSNSVIYTEKNASGFAPPPAGGVVIAWNRQAWSSPPPLHNKAPYFVNDVTHITSSSPIAGTAFWESNPPGDDGISYSFGVNTGFIPLPEVSVIAPAHTVQAVYYNSGTVVFKPGLPANGTLKTTSPYVVDVPYNGKPTFTITPAVGYKIQSIEILDPTVLYPYDPVLIYPGILIIPDPTQVFDYELDNVTQNQVLRVIFASVTVATRHTIIAFAGEGGSFTGQPMNGPLVHLVNDGLSDTVTVNARTGYIINEVRVDGSLIPAASGTASYTHTFPAVTQNQVITANFTPVSHVLTAVAEPGGSITPAPPALDVTPIIEGQREITVMRNSDQLFTITADADYRICDVRVDGESVLDHSEFTPINLVPELTEATFEFKNVEAQHVITATFIPVTRAVFEVEIRHNAGGAVSLGRSGGPDFQGVEQVEHGNSLILLLSPDEDYRVLNITIDGLSVFYDAADGLFSLPNVTGDHVIIITFGTGGGGGGGGGGAGSGEEEPEPDPDDPDDPDSKTDPDGRPGSGEGSSDVSHILITGRHIQYVQGVGEGLFEPDRNVTRAEVAQMFFNLLLEQDVGITKVFPDETSGHWHENAVNVLASLGILKGRLDGMYHYDDDITRAEFVAIAVRFARSLPEPRHLPFNDVSENHWAYEYINSAVQFGWILGCGDGSFQPDRHISRAEAVTIINRMLSRVADREFIDSHEELARFDDVDRSHWGYYDIMEAFDAHSFERQDDEDEHWVE